MIMIFSNRPDKGLFRWNTNQLKKGTTMKFDTMAVNYTISNAPKGEKSTDIECTLEQFLAHEGVAIVNYQQLDGIKFLSLHKFNLF